MGNTICPDKSEDDQFSKMNRAKNVKMHKEGCKNQHLECQNCNCLINESDVRYPDFSTHDDTTELSLPSFGATPVIKENQLYENKEDDINLSHSIVENKDGLNLLGMSRQWQQSQMGKIDDIGGFPDCSDIENF